jgi:hypothetical protein
MRVFFKCENPESVKEMDKNYLGIPNDNKL